jgi:hypothetical protein
VRRRPRAPAPKPRARPLFERLARTRRRWSAASAGCSPGSRLEGDVLEELEALLFGADLGVRRGGACSSA